ncbi:hypothetical protein [Arsukibacterium perlucidum]|uniref:hypothetical protein n=1 Tax=Arsukibacterium perlucidum TaxID=368811 RepID=UPI000365D0F5|nr:hypothetical protein [Arsukibacterium perlucidum]
MQTIFHIILLTHISFGICALSLFWFPAFTKKGSVKHKKFGLWYSYAMHGIVVTAVLMALLSISMPALVKPDAFANSTQPQAVQQSIINFAWLLLHLALLTLVSVRYGQLVLKAKVDRAVIRQPIQLLMTFGLALSGAAILAKGLISGHILMLIFGPLGLFIAATNLHFTFKKTVSAKGWLAEHLGAYITSGIAAYTAFISFGGRHVFGASGYLQLAMWVAPGIIGTLCIVLLSRKYDKPALATTLKNVKEKSA